MLQKTETEEDLISDGDGSVDEPDFDDSDSDGDELVLESLADILDAIDVISLDAFMTVVPGIVSPSDSRLTAAAARADRADIVRYLTETFPAARPDRRVILAAVESDGLRTVRFLVDSGFLTDITPTVWQQILERAVSSVDMMTLFIEMGRDFRHERYIARALRIEAWDSVRFLIGNGANMQQTAALLAAEKASGQILRKMREAGCHFGGDAVPAALRGDNVSALKVLRNFGLVSMEYLAAEAEAAGAELCLAYANEASARD